MWALSFKTTLSVLRLGESHQNRRILVLAPSMLKSYKRVLNKILMGQRAIPCSATLRRGALRTWIVDLSLKATSVRQIIIPLRGALLLAINDDLIESNPLDQVKLQKTLDRDAHKDKYQWIHFPRRRLRPSSGSPGPGKERLSVFQGWDNTQLQRLFWPAMIKKAASAIEIRTKQGTHSRPRYYRRAPTRCTWQSK